MCVRARQLQYISVRKKECKREKAMPWSLMCWGLDLSLRVSALLLTVSGSLSTKSRRRWFYSHVSCISLLHFKEVVNEDDIISFRVRELKVSTSGVTVKLFILLGFLRESPSAGVIFTYYWVFFTYYFIFPGD